MFEQILSNSLKYTPSDGTIKIYMKDGKSLCISDTGIGIDEADLPRIFEKGYTGANGRTDMRASGIGLYLCKNICEKLGCGLSVRSETGKGTEVTINFEQYDLNLTEA